MEGWIVGIICVETVKVVIITGVLRIIRVNSVKVVITPANTPLNAVKVSIVCLESVEHILREDNVRSTVDMK